MNRIEESTSLTPKPAEPRLADLFSETVSVASKGNAARFYAEMMIDLFLSARLKNEIGTDRLETIPLGDQIKGISSHTPSKIVDALWHIKDFGDKASHYSLGRALTEAEADAAVEDAVGLIVLILTNELIETPLDACSGRATLFSTILPKARERVLANLLSECHPSNGHYYRFLLHKYGLALTKSGRLGAARRHLSRLLKKGCIDQAFHDELVEALWLLDKSIKYPGQPIAQRMEDVARNFETVRLGLNDDEAKANERLIGILGTLVNDIIPSGFNHRVTQLLLF
ncbi:hypothetical protein [Paraburkholderia phytofirmans]|uniref:hypothetical protein n=1 Tax=Paraburkholderia phytofirmans TaxID=261302 RepID=UPI0038B9FC6D